MTPSLCSAQVPQRFLLPTTPVWPWLGSPHRHHVITLHVRLIIVFTFVVELAEEVESHHSIEVNNHSQEANRQNQLRMTGQMYRGGISTLVKVL